MQRQEVTDKIKALYQKSKAARAENNRAAARTFKKGAKRFSRLLAKMPVPVEVKKDDADTAEAPAE